MKDSEEITGDSDANSRPQMIRPEFRDEVHQVRIVDSAPWYLVLLWLVTFGRFGSTHIDYIKDVGRRVWISHQHFNCRCSMAPIKHIDLRDPHNMGNEKSE